MSDISIYDSQISILEAAGAADIAPKKLTKRRLMSNQGGEIREIPGQAIGFLNLETSDAETISTSTVEVTGLSFTISLKNQENCLNRLGEINAKLSTGFKSFATDFTSVTRGEDSYKIEAILLHEVGDSAFVEWRQTAKRNYSFNTQDLLESLDEWRGDLQFQVIAADRDCVWLKLDNPNEDAAAIVSRVEEVCESITQMVPRKAVIEKVKRTGFISLFWE